MRRIRSRTVVCVLAMSAIAPIAGLMAGGAASAKQGAPVARTAAVSWPLVKKGAKGERVRSIQLLLNQRENAGLGVDGAFGNGTVAAVKKFQKTHKLGVDGVVGSSTWTKLVVTVKRNNTGSAVRAVQRQLRYHYGYTGVAVDGSFGSGTQTAVKKFQTKYGLPADGVVGEATWRVLEGR